MKISVSVVIPAYNIESYIERAINSVLAQTRQPDEIIVVDDGSTDKTAEKIRMYGDKVRYIYQDNKGLSGARNTGIREAKYEWIAFLDGDDEWLPEKLKLQCDLLARNPELSWAGGNCYLCTPQKGQARFLRCPQKRQVEARKKMASPDFFRDYITAIGVWAAGNCDTMMIRKDVLLRAGLFFEGSPMFEDDDMWMRLVYLDLKYGYVFQPIAVYYLAVPGSLTQRYTEFHYVDDYMQRHLRLSKEASKVTEFRHYARGMLSSRARLYMTLGKGGRVRCLIQKYGDLLPPSYRVSCYLGSFCPPLWNTKEKIKKHIRAVLRRK